MMARVQFITTPKGETLAVMPAEDYEALAAAADAPDEAEEEALAAEMRRLREEDRGAPLGLAEFRRILAGESPIRVWREYRGLSVRQLAARLRMSPGFLSDIETGKKAGSVETLRAIAREFGVSMDDLTPAN
jgi:ribosome-binding protein aMBF1 (putative translation factor)